MDERDLNPDNVIQFSSRADRAAAEDHEAAHNEAVVTLDEALDLLTKEKCRGLVLVMVLTDGSIASVVPANSTSRFSLIGGLELAKTRIIEKIMEST